jgi:hypothetical protein
MGCTMVVMLALMWLKTSQHCGKSMSAPREVSVAEHERLMWLPRFLCQSMSAFRSSGAEMAAA